MSEIQAAVLHLRSQLHAFNRAASSFRPALVVVLLCSLSQFASAQPSQIRNPSLDDPPEPPPEWVTVDIPASKRIARLEFDETTRRTEAHGSDIWPITWADDGNQYAAFGDGGGFGGSNQLGRVSMGVTRIEGDLADYRGINVWGGFEAENAASVRGKGTGIVCIDGTIYMWVGRPKLLGETGIAVSHDHSAHWVTVDWHWTVKDRISAGAFINCGQDYASAPDEYVYACFTRVEQPEFTDRGWIYERPGRVDLARVPKHRMLEQSQWQWFGGRMADGTPLWTDDITRRRPTLEDPNGIKIVSVCYQPALKLYLMTYSPRDNAGNFAMFESTHPWGPWNTVAYLKGEPLFTPSQPNSRVSTFHFAPKWWNSNGREFGLVFNVGDDAWNTVRGRLILK